MNTAQKIIKKFGGQTKLAKLLGKKQSMVQYWSKSGRIPSKWHIKLLELSVAVGVTLSPSDLIDSPVYQMRNNSLKLPEAQHWGDLSLGDGMAAPCYVLDDGRRVISRTGATDVLTDKKGGGNLESYIEVKALDGYLPSNIKEQMIEFTIPNVVNKTVLGIDAELFLDICKAYVKARNDGHLQTQRQTDIAVKAGMFLAACAKVGLIALIDEATGYQYQRGDEALQFKFKLFIEEEMRQWEKTFPDELWVEFGRLTNWKGSIYQRPKYWGKLVNELVYGYLDPDVFNWLKENAPKPQKGQNYHQWLTSQYGLKKLVEHIWMLIGMAKACDNMLELRERMAIQFGRHNVQLNLFIPPPIKSPGY